MCNPGFLYQGYIMSYIYTYHLFTTFDRGRPQIYILNQPLEVGHDGIMGGSRDDPLGETKWRLDPASTKKYMYIYHIYIYMHV